MSSAELFGCPGRGFESVLVDDYPFRNYFSAGIYDGEGALVCGGYRCEDVDCQVTDECHRWTVRETDENRLSS